MAQQKLLDQVTLKEQATFTKAAGINIGDEVEMAALIYDEGTGNGVVGTVTKVISSQGVSYFRVQVTSVGGVAVSRPYLLDCYPDQLISRRTRKLGKSVSNTGEYSRDLLFMQERQIQAHK